MSPGRLTAADHALAFRSLLQIPGVIRVGFGLRESGRRAVEEYAYRVYIREKHPNRFLTARERIPARIGGIPTDVLAMCSPMPSCSCKLNPGDEITRETISRSGTVGMIVMSQGVKCILTNLHVLDDGSTNIGQQLSDVYSPYKRDCLGIHWNSPIAKWTQGQSAGFKGIHPFNGKNYYIDGALAPLVAKVGFENTIPKIGGLISGINGVRDLSSAALVPKIKLRKYGKSTKFTEGELVELFHQDAGQPPEYSMVVIPSPGQDYDETIDIVENGDVISEIVFQYSSDPYRHVDIIPPTPTSKDGATRFYLKGKVFSLAGDSGSVIVDDQRRVVGLMHAGTSMEVDQKGGGRVRLPHGNTIVQYILPLFNKFGLDPATAIIDPSITSSGTAMSAPGDELVIGIDRPESVEDLERDLVASAAGKTLLELAERHLEAIRVLLQHDRRLAVAWHRSRARAYAAAVIRTWRNPDSVVPLSLDGVSPGSALATFGQALAAVAGPALSADLEKYGRWICRLADSCAGKGNLPQALIEWDGGLP